jgi:hypothetical protein
MARTELLALADIGAAGVDAVRHIANNLRASDREEIFATFWQDDPEELVRRVFYLPECGWVATADGEPVAAVGVTPSHPGVWVAWAFGTDRFREAGLLLTRHVKRFIIPMLLRAGAHRCEASSIDGHTEAHRWLEGFGLVREATHPGRGRNGETFHTYARRVERVQFPEHRRLDNGGECGGGRGEGG